METLNPEPEQQPINMLDDVLDTREYDAKVKSAQNAIFVVAGIQVVFGIIMAFVGPEELRNIEIGIAVVIGAIFFGLGLWCKRKPLVAIIIALVLYAALLLLDAIYNPSTLIKGVIVKVAVIVYLVKGINAAKAAQDIKNIGR